MCGQILCHLPIPDRQRLTENRSLVRFLGFPRFRQGLIPSLFRLGIRNYQAA
jgi:hypothetical protein